MRNYAIVLVAGLIVMLAVAGLLISPAVHAQQPHSAALNWTNSTSSCVVNTNVQRSTTSGGETIGNNYAIVPVAGGAHTFTDTAVTAGSTYYYTVSAYGPTCGGTTHESVLSAEFKAVVPPDCNLPSTIVNGVCTPPPNPPGGLSGNVQ